MTQGRFANDGGIVEGTHVAADDLSGLVTLAGNDQKIAGLQYFDATGNGAAPVTDLLSLGARRENFTANGGGVFVARIVVSDDHVIGQLGSDGAHFRPLGTIAIAAAAERHNQTPLGMGTQGAQHMAEGIGGVGVIDKDLGAVAELGNELRAPQDAAQMSQRMDGRGLIGPGDDHQRQRGKRVFGLERPEERQQNFVSRAVERNLDGLAARSWLGRNQTKIGFWDPSRR